MFEVKSLNTTIESSWRGTNVKLATRRSDGIVPNVFQLGGRPEVQTVTFRAMSALESKNANGTTFTLYLGPDFVGNMTYGSDPEQWKTALESLINIERVDVTRTGDGESAHYSYGYAYTIAFWGSYGTEDIPQLTSDSRNFTDVEVFHDTVQEAEIFSDFSARYVALGDDEDVSVRMKAFNSKGVSTPSNVVVANTANIGNLPSKPTSLVLGNYRSSNSLSLSYLPPKSDGGKSVDYFKMD